MENLKDRKQGTLISFLCILCLLLSVSTMYFAFTGNRYKKQERLTNEKAVSSLCESLDSISTCLKKSLYCADKTALEKSGNELCRQAAAAKESLSLLSAEGEISNEIYKFLSQVGNYTLAIAQGENKISNKDAESIKKLYTYAKSLSEGMNEICTDYYNGEVSFDAAVSSLELDGEATSLFYQRVSDASQTFGDYPTLVYDGPFADNLALGKGSFLESAGEITAAEAAKKAAELLGVQVSMLRQEESIKSEIELYCFSKGKIDITVTKKGGYLCSVISDSYAYEEAISAEEAVKRGKEYLDKLGYKSMESTYYSIYDGICTVNYAYADEGIICYGDLIKVSISLDTGKMVAFDAKPYLLSHRKRDKAGDTLSSQQAVKKLSPVLTLIKSRLVFIPLDTGKEALCRELHCKDSEGQEVLVYLDAYTGEQKDMLILLYSDGGVLTK